MKTIMRTPAFTVALFALAIALLGFGTVGAVQAAPSVTSADYKAQVQLADIETALIENGTERSGDDQLLTQMLDEGETLKIGKSYDEVLAVRNTGNIDEYVRVTVRTYWTDKNGKVLDVDPTLIKLGFVTDGGWTIDKDATNGERTVLYYGSELASGADSTPFANSVTIDPKVVSAVTDGNYDYDGLQFRVEAEVDAVQTHNGEAAMTSAWGRTN